MPESEIFSKRQATLSKLTSTELAEFESLLRRKAKLNSRESLVCYGRGCLPALEISAHHKVLAAGLEAIEQGQRRRLMIFCPPRHGKSTWATQLFPAWYLGKHPDRSVITVTYGQDLADDFGRTVRNLVSDPVHHNVFPGFRLADDSSSMRCFNTSAGGSYYAVGRGGPITGRGADLLIIDDPIKDREEAQSTHTRRVIQDWYNYVAYTRLQPGAAIVLIQTRWHQDDLAGWLLREHSAENWNVVSFPAIAERDEEFRTEGEPLWPERFPLADLNHIRQAVGTSAWASLYQQRPPADEDAIFKREWWAHYAVTPRFSRIVQSWDTAFKTGAENDFSVCTTWGQAENGYYLLHVWRDRPEFPELKRVVVSLAELWNPQAILVEDTASGQSIIQELRHNNNLPIKPVKVDSDKLARAQAITPLIEAGKVLLPESAPWLSDFLDELFAFPTGSHSDIVDSLTQALNYFRELSKVRLYLPIVRPGIVGFATNDKEELWHKAALGYPMTEEEIDRM
jgi:predicted phage terminase large subunit-like protein